MQYECVIREAKIPCYTAGSVAVTAAELEPTRALIAMSHCCRTNDGLSTRKDCAVGSSMKDPEIPQRRGQKQSKRRKGQYVPAAAAHRQHHEAGRGQAGPGVYALE